MGQWLRRRRHPIRPDRGRRVKTCFKCEKCLPLSSFYAHPKMADGHLGKCKECAKRDVLANRRSRIDYFRAYDRERYYEQGPRGDVSSQTKSRASAKWSRHNRVKRSAHLKVKRAVDAGRLRRPDTCSGCVGTGLDIQAHHRDYSRPLDVVWLCAGCHGFEHRRYSRELNKSLLRNASRAKG
jgi:hypothetical protein